MYRDKKVVVVMPAYNAEKTIMLTYEEVMAQGCVDLVIVVDDGSHDETVETARKLPGTRVFVHDRNMGYGANQKTCYRLALEEGADIVVMVHPDYQYTPRLIPAMVSLIGNGLYHCVLGSRILGGQALKGGMPMWKYISNRFLTLVENLFIGAKLSEYHTGYRAFSRELLERIPYHVNSDDFVFDNQMLAQIVWFDYVIGEISCPAKYRGSIIDKLSPERSLRARLPAYGIEIPGRKGRHNSNTDVSRMSGFGRRGIVVSETRAKRLSLS